MKMLKGKDVVNLSHPSSAKMSKISASIFVVEDIRAKVFKVPFFAENDSVAYRSMATAVNDPNTEISRFPEDFILHKIGDFDCVSGVIIPEVTPQPVVRALALVRSSKET